jgi:hypothetical protein
MHKKVNLGRKGGGIEVHSLDDLMKETRYPSLRISDVPEALDLPDEGKCVIEYKVVNRSHSPGEKKDQCSITLDVKSLEGDYYGNGKGKKKEEYGEGARKAFKNYFEKE